METLLRDLRFGLRMLTKTPGFTAVSLITLALGIGATTAMFSVVNGVLLRPLPYKESNRLVLIKERLPKFTAEPIDIPAPDVITFQQENRAFEGVSGFQPVNMDLTGIGSPVRIGAARISWNGFQILGVAPLLGRAFTAEEDNSGQYVTVLSYGTWQQKFGGSPDILSRKIELDRRQYQIVGVMPPEFAFPLQSTRIKSADLWVPMSFSETEKAAVGDNFDYGAFGRLKSGVTLPQAEADAESVVRHIVNQMPAKWQEALELHGAIVPLETDALGNVRSPLLIMLAAVIFVLLIAVTNVANLMLARGNSRQKELAIRMALGASGRRVMFQLLCENILLALIGGILGVAAGFMGTKVLVSLVPANIPRLEATHLDYQVLLFALLVSVFSGLVFGAAPALFALRTNMHDSLKEGGRSGGFGKQHKALRSTFVVTQVALALILLIGAGLLIRSFQRVLEVNPGFRPEHVVTGSVSLPSTQYDKPEKVKRFFVDLVERVKRIPGAQYVGASTDLPLNLSWTHIYTPEGYQPPPGAGMNSSAHSAVIGDYFEAMGIPLVRGRLFTPEEYAKDTHAVIISESIAKQFFPDQDPIGQRLKWGPEQSEDPWQTIVGVVGDVKQGAMDAKTMPHTYTPISSGTFSLMNVAVRTPGDPAGTASALQSAVWSLDSQLPVTQIRTMEQVIGESYAPRRFNMILVLVFAGSALLLASVGLYGVMAYSVTQRTKEIGVRMAMGAQQADILRMMMRWGMLLTVIGVAIGTVGSFFVTRLLTDFLFGVKPSDAITFAGVAAVLGLVALLACYIPAKRATKVDPMIALRSE